MIVVLVMMMMMIIEQENQYIFDIDTPATHEVVSELVPFVGS